MLSSSPPTSPYIQVKLEHGILTIMLNRPEAKNAFNLEMYLECRNIIEAADANPDIKVLIVRGLNNDFSAGNDIKSFMNLQFPEIGQAGSTPPFMLLKAIAQFSKPCIAAVRGVCIGVANTFLLHFDMVYADETAIFQMPFVSLSLSLEGAASLLLVQRAGYHQAAEILFCAEKYDAQKALNVGIINDIVDDPYLYADQKAMRLASLPIASLKAVKKLMKHNLEHILKCIDDEAEVVMLRAQSPEFIEACTAFLQKRKPNFAQFS